MCNLLKTANIDVLSFKTDAVFIHLQDRKKEDIPWLNIWFGNEIG